MILPTHSLRQFADAMMALLPPGAAWRWPVGGLGDRIFMALSVELTRLESAIQGVLDNAIELHRPAATLYTLNAYRAVATAALNGLTETMPRQSTRAGRTRAGRRLWSANAEASTFTIPLLQIDHLLGPSIASKTKCGQRLRGERDRFVLRVRYYDTVVEPSVIAAALNEFKQSHVILWFEDITGRAGNITYA